MPLDPNILFQISGAAPVAPAERRLNSLKEELAGQQIASSQQEMKANDLKLTMEKVKAASQVLASANDQASWEQGLKWANENGLPTQGIPLQFDPKVRDDLLLRTLDAEKRLMLPYEIKEKESVIEKNKAQAKYNENRLASATKPIPQGAMAKINELREDYAIGMNLKSDLDSIRAQIESGDLNLGLIENPITEAASALGSKDPKVANYATFRATLEKLRNDSLRLNKGVQTEGDSKRAWNELVQNINNEDVVKQRLADISEINRRASVQKRALIDDNYRNYGREAPSDEEMGIGGPAAVGANKEKPSATSSAPNNKTMTLGEVNAIAKKLGKTSKEIMDAYRKKGYEVR